MENKVIVVGAIVSYTVSVEGKPDKTYPDLTVKSIGKVGEATRVTVTDKKGKDHDFPIEALTLISTPEAKEVKPPKEKKPEVPYDRAAINAQVKADREAGKVRIYADKTRYVAAASSSDDARKVIDIADEVAVKLRGISIADLYKAAAEYVGVEKAMELQTKYAGRNVGMQRMNVGNVMRGAIRAKVRAAQKVIDDRAKAEAKAETAKNAVIDPSATPAPAAPKAKQAKAAKPAAATAATPPTA